MVNRLLSIHRNFTFSTELAADGRPVTLSGENKAFSLSVGRKLFLDALVSFFKGKSRYVIGSGTVSGCSWRILATLFFAACSMPVTAANCTNSPVSGKRYGIINQGSGMALDIYRRSQANGGNAIQWPYRAGGNQQFFLTDLGNGYWSIEASHSGLFLDVAGASAEDGANILQWPGHGGYNQQWQLQQVDNGAFNIVSRQSGKSVTVDNNDYEANIYQRTYAASAYQRWYFNPVDGNCGNDDAAGNQPPVAKVAAVADYTSGQTVTLDGSGSFDSEGGTLTFLWEQTGGEPINLTNHSGPTLSFVAPRVAQPTRFGFQLTVGDGSLSDTARVEFLVSPESDSTAPTAVSRVPQPDQSDVSATTLVSVKFSEALREDLIDNQSLRVTENGNPIQGVVSYDNATYTITNRLSQALSPSTRYTVTVAGTLRDLAGNPVSGESWSFMTAGNGGGACAFPDPPANVSAWINESWNAQLTQNISGRQAWLLDSAIKGKGVINLCLRWGANRTLTAAVRDRIAPAMEAWFNEWFKALGSYGCFPYPNGVKVNLTGVAVKPGRESLLAWNDNRIPIYTETDAEGEPKCPDSCSFFTNWNHEFPSCAAGDDMHFDYSVWLNDTIGGGAAAVGGDWGLRMPVDNFVNSLGQLSNHTIQHEMGHGFGMQDYYDWTGSRPSGGSVMIVGSNWGEPVITVGDSWLIRRLWMEQKSMRGW